MKHLMLLLAMPWFAIAQKGAWGELPMLPPKSFAAKAASAQKIKGTPEHAKALRVYERLCEARGDFRYPVPDFYLTPKETVAEIHYSDNNIFLGVKAFEVCETFGGDAEAALAFLLGHELTHYYEKHAWRGSFAQEHGDLRLLSSLDTLFRDMVASAENPVLRAKLLRFDTLAHQWDEAVLEAQSDYLGGFLAYSAGYGTFAQGDELIRRLYKAFEIPDQLPGYISRSERESLSRQSALRLKDLVEVFEMANLLTATGQYEEAYRYYRKVLVEYQSREVYNNVGAAAMLHALKYFAAAEMPFRYPVQLDLEMANSRGDEEKALRDKLLRQAILHFDAAISLDPSYAPAYLNKACALALLGDEKRAYFYTDVEARGALGTKYGDMSADVEVLLGILDARSDAAKAKQRFEKAALTDKKGLAAHNLAVLEKKPVPSASSAPGGFFDDETIDGQNVLLLLYPEEDKRLNVDDALVFHQNTRQGPRSKLFFSRRYGKVSAMYHLTGEGYSGETARGIRLGHSLQQVESAYGPAPRSVATPDGAVWAYPEILFVFRQGRVARWAVYKT